MLKLFFIFFLIWTNTCLAQTGVPYPDTPSIDNKTIEAETTENTEPVIDTVLYKHIINISPDSITGWKNNRKFGYIKNLDSLLKLKQQKDMALYQSLPGNQPPSFFQRLLSSAFIQAILWLIAISTIIFILYKLFLNKGEFRKGTSSRSVEALNDEVTNADVDYDLLVQQSFKLSDYRMAIRYLFLKTLKRLDERGLIRRATDKTNYRYVQEIRPDKKQDFSALVLNYEFVWYGHLNISREQFEKIEKSYTAFYNNL